jgi:hypothetical protein
MIKYPLKLKITFTYLPDLNFQIFKTENEISYKIDEKSFQITRYKITDTMTEEMAVFEVLYEILHEELNLSPSDLAAILSPVHSEIVSHDGNDFTFSQIKENIYSWAYTGH